MLREKQADGQRRAYPPPTFNLASAIHHLCGGLSFVFESNMGLDMEERAPFTADEILDAHLILVEESFKYILQHKEE